MALEQWIKKHVVVLYVPSYEFFNSLHVLGHPEHHTTRLNWVEETLNALPSHLLSELEYFKVLSNEYLDIMDALEPWCTPLYDSVEAGIEQIETLPLEKFVATMLGPNFHPHKVSAWLNGERDELFHQLKPEHREMINHPLTTKARFIDFLHQYLPYFQKEQRRIEPWLIRAVYEAQERIEKEPVKFMEEIHPRLRLHDYYLEFHKYKTFRFAYQDLQQVYIKPSTFVSPHLLLGIYTERLSVALLIDVPGTTEKKSIPADFIRTMKALSDSTRVSIFKSLLGHPYCIQQLADLHGVSEPAVSKHIKLLAEAELIWGERRGHYVFYKGIPSRLEMFSVDIHQFLDMPDPNSG